MKLLENILAREARSILEKPDEVKGIGDVNLIFPRLRRVWRNERFKAAGSVTLIGMLAAVATGKIVADYSTGATRNADAKAIAAAAGSCLASFDRTKVTLTANDLSSIVDVEFAAGRQGVDHEPSCTDNEFVRTLEINNPGFSYDSVRKLFLMDGHPAAGGTILEIPDVVQ